MENGHTASLNAKHAGIEQRISSELRRPYPDAQTLSKLKREKLKIKESIAGLC